jgi:hypothetical protein
MLEVETFQPLAPQPTFGRTIHGTRPLTSGNGIICPTSRATLVLDHEIQVVGHLTGHVFVAAEFDVLGAGGAHGTPAG